MIQVELHHAGLLRDKGEVLEGMNGVDNFFEHFRGEAEIRRTALWFRNDRFRADTFLANSARPRHDRARPGLCFLDRAALLHHLLRNVRPEDLGESNSPEWIGGGVEHIHGRDFHRTADIGIKPTKRLR